MSKVYSKIDSSGNISWYREGTNFLHREDGPAIEYWNGDKEWYQNGYLYRLDGSAVEYANNFMDNEYYLNGR